MGVIQRIGTALGLVRHTEGEYRPGPYLLPISGGWLSAEVGQYWNWWQMGYDVETAGRSSMVEACVSKYAQTVAMCPGNHWRAEGNGGRKRVTSSALSRILRKPNAYQSISDFLLNAIRSLYLDGNAYALALRNDRFEIEELHLMNARMCSPQVALNGEVFFALGGNEVIDRRIEPPYVVPARDVLHLKLHSDRNGLKGESPLRAAAMQMAAGDAAMRQQIAFFLNQSRPSYVLTTDQVLTMDQVRELRDRWNEQSRGLNSGGTPILTAGLKPQTLSATADDSQLAEMMKLNDQAIANAFQIPLQLFGMGGTPFSSTEALMQFWLANGLGFVLNHIEEAIGNMFGLRGQPEEYLEFDTQALLRSAYKDRIEALARGVQGGLIAPNEGRADLELPAVEFGDEPRVQQQVVPLSAWGQQLEALEQPEQPAQPDPDNDPEREFDVRRYYRAARARHNVTV